MRILTALNSFYYILVVILYDRNKLLMVRVRSSVRILYSNLYCTNYEIGVYVYWEKTKR